MASSLVMIRVWSILMPGTLRGDEPVATMISLRLERLLVALEDLDLALARQPGGALDPVDLVLLEEELDALGEAADNLVLARVHLAHVDRRRTVGNHHAPLLGVLHHLQRVGVLEQRLGGNAAPDQARAAERFLLLDDGDLLAELRGPDRGHVAAGTGADHDDVVRSGHKGLHNMTRDLHNIPMSDRKTLLIVDNDEEMREALTGMLRRDSRAARRHGRSRAADDGEGGRRSDGPRRAPARHQRLRSAEDREGELPVRRSDRHLRESRSSTIAIEAMRLGAYHYTSKDLDLDSVRTLVVNASERQDLSRDVVRLREEVAESNEREFVVGPSQATRDIIELVQRSRQASANVLILGESGTGKELLARLIHREAGRTNAPFVAVNLAAIPKELVESTLFGHEKGAFTGAIRQQLGKFELASGGTLFLDEVGDLRYELQAKLLRAIQEARSSASAACIRSRPTCG